MLKGISLCKGIAMAEAFIYKKETLVIPQKKCRQPEEELEKLDKALSKSVEEIKAIKEAAKDTLDQAHLEIFDAHIQMINDSEIINAVKPRVENDRENIAFAYQAVTDEYVTLFENMDDEYLKERAADIKDVRTRVLSHLLGVTLTDLSRIDKDVIIVAEDLTPSDTAMLNLKYVKGFITQIGGQTSHTAIMARALNVPAICGVKNLLENVNQDDFLVVNAITGEIIINPSQEELETFKAQKQTFLEDQKRLKMYKDKRTLTLDHHHVGLFANIGSPRDLESAKSNGAEGIGLFRTEFLFMDTTTMPSLETQISHYQEVFETIQPVIVRTIDIGGDKKLPYLSQDHEENPFLGHRAIRLCFEHQEIFKTQLKALLIASKDQGELKIMIPMIARADEITRTRAIIEEVIQSLEDEQIKYQKNIKLGIMIEIPSAALNIRYLTKHIDFISIGSNDLIQYLYAADRMNEKVAYLYEPFDPTLLRLLDTIIKEANQAGIETGLCGEMGSQKEIVLLLTAMGIDEISMSPNSLLEAREMLSKVRYEDLKKLLENVLNVDDAEEVKKIVDSFVKTLSWKEMHK